MTIDPRFKTQPYKHQMEAFDRFHAAPWFGLFFEQRCGKTLTTLIIAAEKYRRGEIDSLLIIAPNGVHRNWTVDEIPMHMPVDTNYRSLLWRSGRMETKTAQAATDEFLTHGGLRILAVNVDALTTVGFRDLATRFFKKRRVMAVVDESSDISNGSAKRTKMALKIARRSVVRAILDGTPVAAGPLGLYSQCEFLQPAALGFSSYYAFRARYAELEEAVINDRKVKLVKRFINVDELQRKVARFSSRVLRADCVDLPPKIYQKIYFDLPPALRRPYDELRTTYLTELKSGTVVTASMVLTRYLRLQQISSGFLPGDRPLVTCTACGGRDDDCPACDGVGVLPDLNAPALEAVADVNPRLDALANALAPLAGQCIIWCRFSYDVDTVVKWAQSVGGGVVRYDGAVDQAGRAAALAAFQGGDARWFICTTAASRGLDLSAADVVVYYSHGWSLRHRLQSEDRAQSLKRKTGVLYLDLIASETVDEKIVDALRNGRRLSDMITGDKPENWL